MSSLRIITERIKTLDAEKNNLLLEIEELKKLAESKTKALESEVGMLREEVESLRTLLGVEAMDPPKTEQEQTSSEDPKPSSGEDKTEEEKSRTSFLRRKK